MDKIIEAHTAGVIARAKAMEAASDAKIAAFNKASADYDAAVQKVQDEAAAAELKLSAALEKAGRVMPDQAQNAGKAGGK